MEKMAREMRQKWPHQCYGIFARSSQGHLQWHLPWFFDEYDAVLHGARFLYEMVLMMQKQNEAAATKYIDDWGASNESKWYEIDLDHLTWERAFADFDKVTFGEEFLKICFRQMKAKWDGPKEVMQRQENVEFLKHRMAPQYPPEAFNTQLNAAIPAFNPQPNFGIPFVPHLAHGPNQQQRAAFVTVNGGPYLQSYDGHVAVHDTQHLERHPQRGGRGNRGKPRGGRRPSASEHDQSDDYPGGSSFAPARRESFGRRQSVSDVPPPSQTLARKRTGSLARSHPAMDAGETSRWRPEDLEVGFNQVGKGINYLKVLNLGLISPNTTQKDMCEALEGVGLRVNWVAIHAPKDDNSGDPFGSAELHSTDDVKRGLRMKTIRCNDVDLILSISKRFQRSGREGPDYEVPEHKPPASAYYPRSYSPQDVRSSQETAQQSRRGSFTSQDVLRPNSPMKHTQRGRLGGNAAPGLEAIAEEAGQGRKHAVDDQTKSNRTGKIPRSELAVHEEKENLDQTKIEAAKDASQKSEALATVPPTMEESVQTAPNEPSEVRLAERIRSTEKISKDLDTIHNEQPSASSKNPMKLSVNLGHSEVAAQNSQGLTSGAPQVADLSALGITTPSSRSAGKSTTTSAPLKSDIKEVPVVKRRDHEKTGSRESVGKDSAVSARSDHSAGVSGNPSEQASPSKSTTISKQKKSEGTPTKLTAVQSKQKIAEWQIVTPKKGVQASPQATMPPVVLSPTAEAAARTAPQETPSAAFAPAEPMENAETSGTSQPRIAITPADSPPTTPVTVSQPDLPSLSPWKEDCDKISKVLATLMEKQQRDSAFSLQNIRSGFEKIDQEFEVGLAKYYGGSKTMKKSSRQKLK